MGTRSLVALALFSSVAVAQAQGSRPKELVGTWKLVGVTTDDGPVDQKKLSGGSLVWKLAADGSLAITVTAGARSRTSQGTWSANGDQLTTYENGAAPQRMTWKLVGKQLRITGSDGKVTLKLARVPSAR